MRTNTAVNISNAKNQNAILKENTQKNIFQIEGKSSQEFVVKTKKER